MTIVITNKKRLRSMEKNVLSKSRSKPTTKRRERIQFKYRVSGRSFKKDLTGDLEVFRVNAQSEVANTKWWWFFISFIFNREFVFTFEQYFYITTKRLIWVITVWLRERME